MLNRVQLIGRLGKDPECRNTGSGSLVANISLATDERRKQPDGSYASQTEWHRVTCFGRNAEVARDYLRKGSLIYVEGKIHYDSYENKEGVKVYTTDIFCDRFQMLTRDEGTGAETSAPSGGGGRQAPPRTAPPTPTYPQQPAPPVLSNLPSLEDDDLPF